MRNFLGYIAAIEFVMSIDNDQDIVTIDNHLITDIIMDESLRDNSKFVLSMSMNSGELSGIYKVKSLELFESDADIIECFKNDVLVSRLKGISVSIEKINILKFVMKEQFVSLKENKTNKTELFSYNDEEYFITQNDKIIKHLLIKPEDF